MAAGTVARSPVEKTAEAAWANYASAVQMGGTEDQRRWALDKALEAERKLMLIEKAHKSGR